jgi:hypothetical protein
MGSECLGDLRVDKRKNSVFVKMFEDLIWSDSWSVQYRTFVMIIRSVIHQWLYSPLLGPGLFFSFVIFFTETVGLLGRVISPSQGRYLHKHGINAPRHYALSGIRAHGPSVRAGEDSSCLRPRGHCDRLCNDKGGPYWQLITWRPGCSELPKVIYVAYIPDTWTVTNRISAWHMPNRNLTTRNDVDFCRISQTSRCRNSLNNT